MTFRCRGRRAVRALAVLVVAMTLSVAGCGVMLVDSPRTAGLGCTDSKFYPYVDYLLAIGLTVGMIAGGTVGDAPAALSVPAVFALSGLWGSHKVNQCRERLATATPQDFENHAAAVREQDERDAEARDRQRQLFQQQMNQPTNTGGGGGAPPPQMTGSKTLTINGRTYTDSANGQLGQPCGINNNTCTSPAYACVLVTSSSGVCAPNQ